jgi:hypothetical protein
VSDRAERREEDRLESNLTWIFASPRSGTTWLGALLATATGVALLDEPLIGSHLGASMASVLSLAAPDDKTLFEANASRPQYFFSDASAAAWQPALRRLLLRRFIAFATAAGRSPDDGVLVKEPNGALAAPLLSRAVPGSRLLFVVRDGRDVVDSLLDGATDGWITDTHGVRVGAGAREQFMIARAHHWVHTAETVQQAFDGHADPLRLRVSYEALLADPVAELTTIVRWMGCPEAVPALPKVVEDLAFDNIPKDQTGSGKFARSATPGLWREHFSSEEQAQLLEIMGPTLAQLGYA